MNSLRSLLLLPVGLLVLAGCATTQGQSASEPTMGASSASRAAVDTSQKKEGEILVRAGSEIITVEEFEAELTRRGKSFPGRYADLEQREDLLEEMIRYESLVAMAKKVGFDQDPEIVTVVRRIIANKYLREELDSRLGEVEVTDEEVEAYYLENSQEFLTPERVRAAMVIVELPARASEEYRARQEAKMAKALEESQNLGPEVVGFGVLAKTYSDDQATRYVGGEVGWLYKQRADSYKWGQDVVDAIFALQEPGELSSVIPTEEALYLLRLVEREEQSVVPLEKIQASLRSRIMKDRRTQIREAFYQQIREELEVTVDQERLEAIPPPPSALESPEDEQPPPLPGG